MTKDKETISVLNDLIETCNDGVKGFRTAAESVTGPRAKTVFATRATEIEKASHELAADVRKLGGEPEDSGSAAGAVHRGWLDLKAAVTGGDDDGILAECARGEDHAIKTYDNALKKDLPAQTRTMIQNQRNGAIANLDIVRQMKKAA
ncbi:MAG: PA2169 family four-helix-bundle protein [Gemmatimonadaceae bacterium]